ncbi:MAG: hypothetical protein AAFN77_03820 [Planctomycetota bacterium]
MTIPCVAQDDESSQTKTPETIYSGPQVGEALPAFKMKMGFGEQAGKEVDLVTEAGENSVVVIFVHKKSRPAFGLANAIMRYCNQDGGDKLTRGICFLTPDATETQNWLSKINRYFPKGTPVGYSAEGIEGPGAMGLNRNVELTVLVAKAKKVTANFALVQPGAYVDGPKILAAIAEATGGEKKPNINKYLNSNQSVQDAPIAIDPGLMKQIKLINAKDAKDEDVGEAIEEINKMIADSKPLQMQLGTLVVRWTRSNRVDNIGNEVHQKQIKEWAKQYGPKMRKMRPNQGADRPKGDAKLTGLLRSVIQKSNSDEQVDTAAKAVEEYVDANPAAAKELARITNTVVNSDKLANYGTQHCQEILKGWAEKYKTDKKK